MSPSGPGWYLVGDAAGLVDPITREGIYFALLSGQWAADAILSGAAAAPQSYAPARARGNRRRPRPRGALQGSFFRPRFTRLLIDALQHSAGVRAVMADLVAGQQDYAGLKWRLVKTLRPGLAARLMFTATRRPFRAGVTDRLSVRNDCIRLDTVDRQRSRPWLRQARLTGSAKPGRPDERWYNRRGSSH